MKTPAGVCRFCGCSEYDACVVDDGFSMSVGCSWTDRTRTVCSACAPAAKAEAIALRTLARAGYRSATPGLKEPLDFVQAYHRGFLVGWFAISRRSPYGRNPYRPAGRLPVTHTRELDAWDLGERAGAVASQQYQRVCGPLPNEPRRELLRAGADRKTLR